MHKIQTGQNEHIARYNLFTIKLNLFVGTKDADASCDRIEQLSCLWERLWFLPKSVRLSISTYETTGQQVDLKPVEAMTIRIMTIKVGLSPVAILTIASAVRMKLNGCAVAVMRRVMALGAHSVTKILGPCLSNAERAASSVKPRGLKPGSRLFKIFWVSQRHGWRWQDELKNALRRNTGQTCEFVADDSLSLVRSAFFFLFFSHVLNWIVKIRLFSQFNRHRWSHIGRIGAAIMSWGKEATQRSKEGFHDEFLMKSMMRLTCRDINLE